MLRHSVEKFLNHPQIDAVMVVYNKEHIGLYEGSVIGLPLLPPVLGGITRHESVRLGIEQAAKYNPEKVLIHDAARPMIDDRVISDVVNALDLSSAVIPAVGVQDTIKKCENGDILNTIPRDGLFCAQTPQGFVFKEIMQAIRNLEESGAEDSVFTDESSLFEFLGKPVKTIAGSVNNFKITTKDDLERAELLMTENYETRVGMGFDAHKFCAPKSQQNNNIVICGVQIPHPFSLEGHSDADVGLHAAVDAILGAISAGDIGTHFPPSDPQWKGVDSAVFLKHAAKLLQEAGAKLINIDITIICELPKILPHREKMCETIARILDIESARVSVKATTTEGMGFTGRKEGVAAQAIANLRLSRNI